MTGDTDAPLRTAIAGMALALSAGLANAQNVTRTQITPEGSTFTAEAVHGWVEQYFEGTRSMNAATWAAAFAPNAVLDDPVGLPVKDTPDAILAQGEGFVGTFTEIGLYETFVHVVGNKAVAHWQGRGITPDGTEVTFDGINHFTFNEDGQITLLRGFFTPPGM